MIGAQPETATPPYPYPPTPTPIPLPRTIYPYPHTPTQKSLRPIEARHGDLEALEECAAPTRTIYVRMLTMHTHVPVCVYIHLEECAALRVERVHIHVHTPRGASALGKIVLPRASEQMRVAAPVRASHG